MTQPPNNGRSAWTYGAAALSLAVLGSGLVYYIVEDDKKVKRRKAGKKAERAALRTLQQIKDEAVAVEKKLDSVNITADTVNDDEKTFKQKEFNLAHSNELLLRLMERLDAIRPLVLIMGDNIAVKPNEFEEHLAATVRNKKRSIIGYIESLFRRVDATSAQLKEKAVKREEMTQEKAARLEKEKEEAERLAREKEEAVRKEKEREAEEEQARIAQEEAQRRKREEEEEERLTKESAAKEALAKELENAIEALAETKNSEVIEATGDEEETAEMEEKEDTTSDSNDKVELAVDEGARTPDSHDYEHVERVDESAVEDKTDVDVPENEVVVDNDTVNSSVLKSVEDELEDEAMEKDTTTVEEPAEKKDSDNIIDNADGRTEAQGTENDIVHEEPAKSNDHENN